MQIVSMKFQILFSGKNMETITVKPVLSNTYGKAKNWLLKKGPCLIQVDFHFFAFNGISYSGL